MSAVPPSLLDASLAPLWAAVRERLERNGTGWRGGMRVPQLNAHGRHLLSSLLDGRRSTTLDLAQLEAALARLGVGVTLAVQLAALHHPVSPERDERRAAQQQRRDAYAAARAACAGWPEEWARSWIDGVIRAGLVRGLGSDAVLRTVDATRACLDALADPNTAHPQSRVELAARVLGDAHALDVTTRLGTAVQRALRYRFADALDDDVARSVWDHAGVPADTVSAPALTWNLPVLSTCELAPIVSTATSLGVVVHLSQMALRAYPVRAEPHADVLVAENPRVVEAAAQRRTPFAVIASNGHPSTAVQLLVRQLLASGVLPRYHGDFDAPGIAMCRRMVRTGLVPWRMSTAEYRAAIDEATRAGVELPVDDRDPGATPWDANLSALFRATQRAVHEERLLDRILVAADEAESDR